MFRVFNSMKKMKAKKRKHKKHKRSSSSPNVAESVEEDSSSSQEVPRVSQRAASTTDLLADSESAQEYSSSKLPAAATAPNTPLQQRKHQQSYSYSTSQGVIAFSTTPTRTQCCFLTSSCRSCFQSDNPFATFHNNDPPIHDSVDASIKCSVTTSHQVSIPKLDREKDKLVYSSDAESESGSTVNSDGSFSSTSLDFEKSETNSKSLEESDIKRLIDAIKSIETDEDTPQNYDSEPILEESVFNVDSLNEDKTANALVSLSDSDSSEDVNVHDFPVTKLNSEISNNSVRKEEAFIVERSQEFDSDSESSYDDSSSSGSSVDTLVFNPYIIETHNKNIYETSEVSDTDSKTNGITSITSSLQYSHDELNLNSDDEDVEFSYLESECQSSDSECESIVLEELEEIFRKFGFLSNLEDFHYNEFRSIGRYSTIHEESGEDSEGSNTSLVQGNIVKTSYGMGQYYATSITPTNETQNQIKMADLTNKITCEPKAEEARRDIDEHHYDDVDLEDLKSEDILDYKSDQFSRSPRSSPNSTVNSSWRTSQASTNTIGSSSTAAGSDDTLGKDMSELSSINSRLSTINDQSDPGFSTIDRKTHRSKKIEEQVTKDVLTKVQESEADVASKMSPESTLKSTRIEFSKRTPTSHKKQTSTIKDAIEDLEFIELAAKNLLEQEKSKKKSSNLLSKSSQECTFLGLSPGTVAPASSPSETRASIKEQAMDDSGISAEVEEQNVISETLKTNKPTLITVEIVGVSEKVDTKKSKMAPSPPPRRKHEGKSKKKKDVTFDSISEDKPPLPPSASPIPKPEVKKRWWSRSKEPPLFISRESYNEEQVVKELERLRQSYKESDLNDFLDALDKTSIPPDIDEEFFEQLLSDLREDLKVSASKSTESLNVITEAPLPSTADAHEGLLIDDNIQPKSRPRSSSASNKFEKVKERVKELLRRRKKGKQQKAKLSTAGVQDSNRPETPQSRPITPQSRSGTPDARGSRPHTPESTKSDDTKKNFSISGFFKKSSPNFLRKKYGEKKHRKSDTTVTSESDAEDTDASKLNSRQASNQKLFESGGGSNLKGSKSSLNGSQELKKEVRFCENILDRQDECDKQEMCYSNDQKPTIVEVKAKKQEVVAVEEVCENVRDSVPKECDLAKQSTEDIITNDAVEQSQSVIIPLTIENLNRAENLLPKLPERAKPPRRKKKTKLIPVPIEDLTVDDFRCSFISDQSQESHLDDSSVAASEDQSGVLNKIDIGKDITEAPGTFSPPEKSTSTETTENVKNPPNVITSPEREGLCDEEISSDRVDQVPETSILPSKVILAYEAPPPPSVTPSQADVEDTSQSELIADLPAQSIEPEKFSSKGNEEHNDNLLCKDFAKNDRIGADSINDDISSINTYSDITETNSTKEPSPAPFPDLNENAPSFYDNNNPFEDALSKIIEEDTAKTSNETSTPKIGTPEAVNAHDEGNEPEILHSEQMANTISTTKKLEDTSEKATSGIDSCTPCTGITLKNDAMDRNAPQQVALSSPSHESQSESKPLSSEIDALTSLAEEMAHLTCELEEESEANVNEGDTGHSFTKISSGTNIDTLRDFSQSISPTSFTKHIHDSSTPDLLSRVQVNNVQQSFAMSNTELFDPLTKNSAENLNLEKETNQYDQFQHHKAYSYKGSGSCITPSKLDQITPATTSKSFYRPSATCDYMHLSNSYNDNQNSSQTISNWVKSAENPVPVPPRQFQQKMPMNVVAELKTLLSDNETAPILRKAPEPLPRWDSNIKFSEIAKKIPPSNDCVSTSSGFAPSASGRSIPSASETLLSTKPELILPAHSSETLVTDPNNAVNNVSVKSNLTSAVNDTLASSDSKVFEKYESEEMGNTNIIVNNQSVALHDSQPTECSKAVNIGVAGKYDKETNVCLPQTTIIDKSTGPDSTFKLRATVYAKFEPSDGWNYQKRKPPVPRRRLGCSLFLEDGYQSDSGISKLSKRKIHQSKCFSLFVESDRGYMSDYPSSTIGPIKGKVGASSDMSSGKLQNKGTESIPSRPPPPKSISLIPTLLFMSEGDLRIPPPVPARRSFLQLHDDQHSRRMVRNDAYIDLWSSECINRQTKIELQVAGISGRPQTEPDKPSADAATGGDTASWADKACVSKLGACDVNCVSGVDVGGDYGGVVVGAGGDRRVSGLVPKVSASSVSEADQCFPLPSTHSNIAAQTQLNNTCDNLPSQSESTAIAQSCDSVVIKKDECGVVARATESSSDTKFSGPSVKESLGSKVFNTCDRQSSGEVKLRRDVVPGGLFASKLKRASRLLDELDKMEVLSPPRYSNHLPDSYLVNTERAPTPPLRPRTPIDERDPEQVRAEKRYEGYFQGTPRAIHKPNEIETTPEPTPQQIQAAQRYSNYFLGPPRAQTPTESSIEEPDEEQIAAQKRYEGYFKKGPPRSRPLSEGYDRPPPPDREQLEAEERYQSYFQSGPPRPPRPPTPETDCKPEPDAQQKAAEKRYVSYFKGGPPRPKSQADIDFGLGEDKRQEAERRYQRYFEGPPKSRCSSLPDKDRTPSPDEQQKEAEKRYQKYFTGPPRAKHGKEQETPKPVITQEMLEAEERLNKYFLHPVPCGEPRQLIDPPLAEEEIHRRKLLAEYWSALQERNKRRTLKVVKVSKAKNEIEREVTPPTQRDLVVEEFLQKVKHRKKERDLHYGDTDSEDEGEDHKRKSKSFVEEVVVPPDLKLEGGGTLAERVASDLGNFIGEEALQQLGLNESSLLGEIENILGIGSLSKQSTAPQSRISPPKGFSLSEYSKPTPTSFSYQKKDPPHAQKFSNAKTDDSAASEKPKWMRTATGGYVKAPSQESLIDSTRGSKESLAQSKSSPTPGPQSPKASALYNTQTSHVVAITSESKINSIEQTPTTTTFVRKSTEFNQPNQFITQYSQAQLSSSPQRSTSLTRTDPNNVQSGIGSFQRSAGPSLSPARAHAGGGACQPPSGSTESLSGPPQPATRLFYNKSPVAFSSIDKGDRVD